MTHSTDSLLIEQSSRVNTSLHTIIRGLRRLSTYFYPLPLSELLLQLEQETEPARLTKTVNRLQNLLWKLSTKEQAIMRKKVINVLSKHVLQGTQRALRIEAAGWLRLFLQAGLVTQPEDIFVTLVTATIRLPVEDDLTALNEQMAYLKMIFQGFWPFRHTYPAYTWQVLPANDIFYPLAPLFDHSDYAMQDALMGIFAELPSLDDAEILEHLLPVALQWSKSPDPERRRRVANVLARIDQVSTQEALRRLQTDVDPVVQTSAKRASGYVRRA